MRDRLKQRIQQRIKYHADERRYRYEIGKGVMECLVNDLIDDFVEMGGIIPPCKVGDTVYVITEKRPCYACFYCTDYCHLDCKFDDINKLVVKEATVESIFYSGTAKRIKVEVKRVKNLSRYSLEIGFSKINETLFLSKEDAEEALKKRGCNT